MGSMQKKIAILTLVSQAYACNAPIEPCASSLKNAHNGIQCDISYASLQTDNLKGIKIQDYGIPQSEKIRHLNEINSMPKEFLSILRAKTTINLSAGGITNIPAYANLRGVTPRGWPAGSTWDSVPGVGGVENLGLGDSNLATGTNSLALHEAGHSVSMGVNMLNAAELKQAFQRDNALPNASQDPYRMNYIEEYVASAIDDYYCNSKSRANLKAKHPNAFSFMETHFLRLLKESGIGKDLPEAPVDPVPVPDPKPKPDPTLPDPVKDPTPKPDDPVPTPTPIPTPTIPPNDEVDDDDPAPEANPKPGKSPKSEDALPEVDPVLRPVKKYNMCQ